MPTQRTRPRADAVSGPPDAPSADPIEAAQADGSVDDLRTMVSDPMFGKGQHRYAGLDREEDKGGFLKKNLAWAARKASEATQVRDTGGDAFFNNGLGVRAGRQAKGAAKGLGLAAASLVPVAGGLVNAAHHGSRAVAAGRAAHGESGLAEDASQSGVVRALAAGQSTKHGRDAAEATVDAGVSAASSVASVLPAGGTILQASGMGLKAAVKGGRAAAEFLTDNSSQLHQEAHAGSDEALATLARDDGEMRRAAVEYLGADDRRDDRGDTQRSVEGAYRAGHDVGHRELPQLAARGKVMGELRRVGGDVRALQEANPETATETKKTGRFWSRRRGEIASEPSLSPSAVAARAEGESTRLRVRDQTGPDALDALRRGLKTES